ncbi:MULTISPECIES: heme A synthase [unclassified Rhizobacter]|uniref:COX15/CtaA family protein n=1 Tax=unclassified Rhizobacter TaxID=2640088 RepID=UPI0006F8708E|nr:MULTISPECIES: COX15/CtaA family protein [unclassified Rhizobacter]KQU74822.1 cytochrome C oxidase subunit I [Rhizobacter sp. Root29]KQW01103.1 cytochrome C oxidase subunit I [Rhizobacter sp. Root1238]KRB03953.1 cytochrome C oxidase subunit I [Rhizobacter sp. Root16D2]
MGAVASYDLSPLSVMALVALLLATGPLVWVALRHRRAHPATRLRALTVMTLFLTFDLVLFGAFTRLSDSGLGCPDWPGCYGNASPLGAQGHIDAAQAAMPSGPVTHGKAWVEMVHRYLASAVGVLIIAITVAAWRQRRRDAHALSPWWATATLGWVCLQGAFGALTVTMKLFPAIVTLHLLGGLGLLMLLAVQAQADDRPPLVLPAPLRRAVWAVLAIGLAQVVLGGWVSTNYAVLACADFPTCQGAWWPAMDFEHGFAVWRELGAGKDGGYLPFAALTAIHMVHRLGAVVTLSALLLLAWRLHASGDPVLRRWALRFAAVAAWQLASGLGNVVLGWPLVAALAHTGGAAALLTLLAALLARAHVDVLSVGRRSAAAPAWRHAS